MPLQNRVTPRSELVAVAGRGLVYGNRGNLHDDEGRIRRRFGVKRWISCRLRFKDRHRGPLLQPGKFTELFFLDEATAFAAGHRPCAECRREDYDRFGALWAELHGGEHGADAMDARLHDERVDPSTRAQRVHHADLESLPNGAFVLDDAAAWLVVDGQLLRWTPDGYDQRRDRRGSSAVAVLTPPSLVEILRRGWDGVVPLMHPTGGVPTNR